MAPPSEQKHNKIGGDTLGPPPPTHEEAANESQ